MTTWDFIIALFYQVDEQMRNLPKHPHASLWRMVEILHRIKRPLDDSN